MHTLSSEPSPSAASEARSARRPVGIGRVLLWNGGSLWMGRQGGAAHSHAHHAIQITIALTGSVLLKAGKSGDWREMTAAIVMPDRPHSFDGQGFEVAMIFVEPETPQGEALKSRFGDEDISALPSDVAEAMADVLRAAMHASLDDEALKAEGRRALALLTGAPAERSVDPRIERVIAWLRARLDSSVSLEEAAAQAHLSASRFRHLFVSQTGVPFRAYLLWARVELAVGLAMGGQSWTQAAQQAGFADSAHLTRTCRRMFGVAPMMLVREQA
jgi:AraC family transcriptional regulator